MAITTINTSVSPGGLFARFEALTAIDHPVLPNRTKLRLSGRNNEGFALTRRALAD
jgi:hypothetical protein